MSSTLITIIAVAVVVGAVALVAVVYYSIRHSRGSMKLTLPKTAFGEGDQIEGTFTMTTKKDIDAKKLFVALIGTEVTVERYDDNQTRTHRREAYRDEQILEGAKTIPAGHSADYSFQLIAPTLGGAGESVGGTLGNVLDIGLDLLGGDRHRLEWKLEARLDAEGIDLATSETVYIGVSGTQH